MDRERVIQRTKATAYLFTGVLTAVMAAALLPACGGGGGGGDGGAPAPTTGAPTPAAATYLHHTDTATATSVLGTLTTIDPAAPTVANTNAAAVDPAAGCTSTGCRSSIVYAGAVAGTTGTIANFRRHAVVFSSGGKIMKQSAVIGGSVPAAVQVSSASGFTYGPGDGSASAQETDICNVNASDRWDFQTPDSSWVFFRSAGTNKICDDGDDLRFATRLGAGSSVAPVDLVALGINQARVLYDASLAVSGFVALDAVGSVVQLDANLANPVATTGSPAGRNRLEVLARMQDGRILMLLNAQIRTYDPASKVVGATLATIASPGSWSQTIVQDSSNFFFVDDSTGSASPNVIQRISLAPPAPATAVVTEAAGTAISNMAGTSTRLVYVAQNAGNAVRSVPKSASGAISSTALYPASATTDDVSVFGVAPTGLVYIQRFAPAGGADFSVTAAVVKDDGTGLATHADGLWAVTFFDTTFNFFDGSGDNLSQIVLAQRAAAGSVTDANAVLTAYDAATHSAGATLGTMPADLPALELDEGFDGPRTLIRADTAGGATELLYIDALTAGSLVRITNTPTVSETPVF